MHLLPTLLLALATLSAALPSNSQSRDNAYPETPEGYNRPSGHRPQQPVGRRPERYDAEPTTTPCTSATPTPTPTSTPCTEKTRPTAVLPDAGSQNGVKPDSQTKCPAPVTTTVTRTLPPVVQTATRTVHDVRTATVTSIATVTATSTVVKPVHHTTTVTKNVEHTVTKTCTKTLTVQELVTKTKYVTETKDRVVTKTIDHTVTTTVGALPTHANKPTSDYGPPPPTYVAPQKDDKPAYGPVGAAPKKEDKPAYGPVDSYKGDVSPSKDNKYDNGPSYIPSGNQDSTYGY